MRDPIILAILAAGVLTLVVGVYTLIRNDWVYATRIALLRADYAAYERLPSYNAMLARFWVWDIRKFIAEQR